MSDTQNEWRRICSTTVALLPREGWIGVWDALVAVVMRRPRTTVPTDISMSVYVKGPKDVTLALHGPQLTTLTPSRASQPVGRSSAPDTSAA